MSDQDVMQDFAYCCNTTKLSFERFGTRPFVLFHEPPILIVLLFCRESEDTALLLLKEIYKSRGIQPEQIVH